MAEVSATLVKELREKTGAGMMDCKKALAETGGDVAKAEELLRKKGLSARRPEGLPRRHRGRRRPATSTWAARSASWWR